jgi:predicted tellurium resistance membrane protein TerC
LKYLRFGLASVLVFVGGKMLLARLYKVPIVVSLAVVAVLLAGRRWPRFFIRQWLGASKRHADSLRPSCMSPELPN